MCIFPFEIDFFKTCGTPIHTVYTGNPLTTIIQKQKNPESQRDSHSILILPGSRNSELKYCFKRMFDSIAILHHRRPEFKWHLAATDEKRATKIRKMIALENRKRTGENTLPPIEIHVNQTLELMQTSTAALATSGTVTLEAALLGLPLVSIYAGAPLSFYIASKLIKLYRHFFTLPNIIANKCLYEEYVQYTVHPHLIVPAMERILPGGERRDYVLREISQVKNLLSEGTHGDPIASAVDEIFKTLDREK